MLSFESYVTRADLKAVLRQTLLTSARTSVHGHLTPFYLLLMMFTDPKAAHRQKFAVLHGGGGGGGLLSDKT